MEQTECSETSAYKIQMPGNYPEENIQHTEHGESLKSRIHGSCSHTLFEFHNFYVHISYSVRWDSHFLKSGKLYNILLLCEEAQTFPKFRNHPKILSARRMT